MIQKHLSWSEVSVSWSWKGKPQDNEWVEARLSRALAKKSWSWLSWLWCWSPHSSIITITHHMRRWTRSPLLGEPVRQKVAAAIIRTRVSSCVTWWSWICLFCPTTVSCQTCTPPFSAGNLVYYSERSKREQCQRSAHAQMKTPRIFSDENQKIHLRFDTSDKNMFFHTLFILEILVYFASITWLRSD